MSKEYCQLCQREHEVTTACPNVRFGTSHEIGWATRELQQWEYMDLNFDTFPALTTLNELGADGWELACVTPYSVLYDTFFRYYFKRKK